MENWNLNNLYVEIGRENPSPFKDTSYTNDGKRI